MPEHLGNAADGTPIIGMPGSQAHVHETGFSSGMITTRGRGGSSSHLPYDNSVRDINEILSQNPNFPKDLLG